MCLIQKRFQCILLTKVLNHPIEGGKFSNKTLNWMFKKWDNSENHSIDVKIYVWLQNKLKNSSYSQYLATFRSVNPIINLHTTPEKIYSNGVAVDSSLTHDWARPNLSRNFGTSFISVTFSVLSLLTKHIVLIRILSLWPEFS